MPDISQLRRVCAKGLAAIGYRLVDLEFFRDNRGWVVRVFIDHAAERPSVLEPPRGVTSGGHPLPASAVDLGDCRKASEHLGVVLDVEDPVDTAYRLEVSSPGVRRPLVTDEDFERFLGYRVRVTTVEKVENRKNFCGILTAASAEALTLEIDGQPVDVPRQKTKKARLELDA